MAEIFGTNALAETIPGTTANDVIYGGTSSDPVGTGADTILSDAGNDVVYAGDGDDSLEGGAGEDSLSGGAGNDTLRGGLDYDVLSGGAGDDVLDGFGDSGKDNDWNGADYKDATGGIVASFGATSTVTGDASVGNDTLLNINVIRGSEYADTITIAPSFAYNYSGSSSTTEAEVRPGGGDDVVIGNGNTRLRYSDAPEGVFVNLGTGRATDLDGNLANGGVGTDTIAGINAVDGSEFADSILGGAGHERFRGRSGDDTIDGAGGTDRVRYNNALDGVIVNLATHSATSRGAGDSAQVGTDTLYNIEEVDGSEFDDEITGDSLANRLNGRNGNDTLDGGEGNDTLSGGAGDDVLKGGAGANVLDGGAGNDTYIYDAVSSNSLFDSGGIDTIIVDVAVNTSWTLSNFENFIGNSGNDVVNTSSSNRASVHFAGNDGNDNLSGGSGDDTLEGGAGNDQLNGNAGNDVLRVGADGGSAWGGEGNDTLYGSTTAATAGTFDPATGVSTPPSGTSYLSGGAGDDRIIAVEGFISANGGAGQDVITGSAGNDYLHGNGDTVPVLDAAGNPITYQQTIGTQTFTSILTQSAPDGNDTIDGGAGNDNIYGGGGADSLLGGDGDDYINGNGDTVPVLDADGKPVLDDNGYRKSSEAPDGDDTLEGGAGNDQLNGNAGNDVLRVGADGGSAWGGEGNDTLYGSTTAATAGTFDPTTGVSTPPSGTSYLSGGAGDDRIIAVEGFISANGGAGQDVITGSAGNDYLHGNGEFVPVLDAAGNPITYQQTFGTQTLTVSVSQSNPADGNDTIDGGAGNDNIYGGGGADSLLGGDGDDWIYGNGDTKPVLDADGNPVFDNSGFVKTTEAPSDGNDTLDGGAGNDNLYGNAGNDSLDGGAGNDILIGGEGNDRFVFSGTFEHDSIVDLAAGDIIDLSAYGFTELAGNVTLAQSGPNVFLSGITGAGGSAISVYNASVEQVAAQIQVACLLAGTRVKTPGGNVPVEDLAIGDLVCTVDGRAEPIKWIGRRAYARAFVEKNPQIAPIRIAAGALGDHRPERDLFVSPGHALLIDGVLVLPEHLLNGTTITIDKTHESVSYFHIECLRPEVLITEGTPSESYVDDGNRRKFTNYAEYAALFGEGETDDFVRPRAFPRVTDGPALEAIRKRLGSIKAA